MSVIDDAFNALFYGTGAWLGILLFLTLIIALFLAWKYTGVLTFPITLYLGISYLNNSLLWHASIMFFTSAFILIALYKKKG